MFVVILTFDWNGHDVKIIITTRTLIIIMIVLNQDQRR